MPTKQRGQGHHSHGCTMWCVSMTVTTKIDYWLVKIIVVCTSVAMLDSVEWHSKESTCNTARTATQPELELLLPHRYFHTTSAAITRLYTWIIVYLPQAHSDMVVQNVITCTPWPALQLSHRQGSSLTTRANTMHLLAPQQYWRGADLDYITLYWTVCWVRQLAVWPTPTTTQGRRDLWLWQPWLTVAGKDHRNLKMKKQW